MIARQPTDPAPASASFEAIYETHQRDVLRYAALMLRDPDEAADVTAEAFTRAWDAWTSGRGPTGRPLPWLLVITRRLIVDGWRRRRRIAWLPLLEGFAEPAPDRIVETDFWLWLDELAAALPARQREVLFLRYRRDLTDAETGAGEFESTAAGRWLAKHAPEYGFVLSYPAGAEAVTCYGGEPWHVRYVGREIAAQVTASGLPLRAWLWQHAADR